MSNFRKYSVWNNARQIFGSDPQLWRMDPAGHTIYWHAYGDRSHSYGWEIGHITALADGGLDAFFNIQAEHWITNLAKEALRKQRVQNFGNLFSREAFIGEPFRYFGNQ